MDLLRRIIAVVGLVALAIVLNVVLITGALFSPLVMTSTAVALLSLVFWVALLAIGAIMKRRGDERVMQGTNAIIGSVLMFAICIVIYAFAARWNVSWDLTREGRAPLAPLTIQVLQSVTEPVEVYAFFSGVEATAIAIARDKADRFFNRCDSVAPDALDVEFVDLEADPFLAEELGVSAYMRAEVAGIIALRLGSKKRIITLDGINPRVREADFTNALINVLRSGDTKVYFLEGHNEVSIAQEELVRKISQLSRHLSAEGYMLDALQMNIQNPVVPDDCTILAIIAPEHELSPGELAAIQDYADQGGRLFIALDPVVQAAEGMSSDDRLRIWLENYYGIAVGLDMLVAMSVQDRMSVYLTPKLDGFPVDEQSPFKGSYNYEHPITRGFIGQMIWLVTRTVTYGPKVDGVVRDAIVRSQEEVFSETRLDLLLKNQSNPEGKTLGPLNIAMAATKKTDVEIGDTGRTRDSRIVVLGDATFMSDSMLPTNRYSLDFALNTFAWLSESEDLIGTRAEDDAVTPLILSRGEIQAIAWISTLGVLQAIVLAGIVVYIMRRRKA